MPTAESAFFIFFQQQRVPAALLSRRGRRWGKQTAVAAFFAGGDAAEAIRKAPKAIRALMRPLRKSKTPSTGTPHSKAADPLCRRLDGIGGKVEKSRYVLSGICRVPILPCTPAMVSGLVSQQAAIAIGRLTFSRIAPMTAMLI